MIRGAIFDLDGVLLDSMGIWEDLGARYLRRLHITPEPGLNEVLFPMSMEQGAAYLKAHYPLQQSEAEICGGIAQMLKDYYVQEVPAKPGAAALLVQPPVEAAGGVPQVLRGMSVTEGQLLISGVEDTGTFGTRFTAGLGSVEGRTWYTLTANVPLTGAEKRYTGREKRLHSVIFGSRRIKFFANSSIDSGQCDKITERTPVRVCGIPLPITWETETLRFYETEPVTVTQARRQKETGAALEAYLHSLVDPYGEVTASQVTSRLRGDVLTVTLTAECREELGTQAPIYTANEPDGASG